MNRAVSGAASYRRGLWAERVAWLWYMLQGYRCLARRYKTPVGEIDLIVQRGHTLVFIEVKARPDAVQGLYAISPASRRRLRRTVDHYLQAYPVFATQTVRFDLFVVLPRRLPFQVCALELD